MEEIIGRIASGSHGVVTREELLRAGVSRSEVEQRLATAGLLSIHRGVYRVGHRAPSALATYLAAVKAGGDGALLAGRASAHLLQVVKGEPPPAEIITLTERRIEGVVTRRTRCIHPLDATTCRGIPTTTVPRTLVDLAAVLDVDELARACHEAWVRYRMTPARVEAVLARRPTSPGAAALRRVLRGDVSLTLSKLEKRFVQLIREIDRPLPVTNRPAGGRHVDCRWPEHHLTVELDSYRFHASRHAWEQDRRREREAYARGDGFRRYTWGDVFEDPQLMLSELCALVPPLRRRR